MRGQFGINALIAFMVVNFAGVHSNAQNSCHLEFEINRKQERVIEAVRKTFPLLRNDRNVLPKIWMKDNQTSTTASTGFCFAAASAAYHLLGGKSAGLKPMVATYYDPELERIAPESHGRATHWWVQTADGKILDPTADQYTDLGLVPPYHLGKGAGFNRPITQPTKAGQKIMDLALQFLNEPLGQ